LYKRKEICMFYNILKLEVINRITENWKSSIELQKMFKKSAINLNAQISTILIVTF